jgi:hypothetical protein
MNQMQRGAVAGSGRAVWRAVQGATGLAWPVDVQELSESGGRFLAVRPPEIGSLLSVRLYGEGQTTPIVRLLQPLSVQRHHLGAWLVWGQFTAPLSAAELQQLNDSFERSGEPAA